MDKTGLGDRMKQNYESRCKHKLIRRTPVIVRLDGKAFHSYTRGMPMFHEPFMWAMAEAAAEMCQQVQGFKFGFVQSDEVSILITDYDDLGTDAYFGYTQNKIESVLASMMTAYFNRLMNPDGGPYKPAFFDARAFSIPREEVTNYFLWRAKDWERNSIQMYAQANFSQKELHGKSQADMHDMLHGKGLRWAHDISERGKNGTYLLPSPSITHRVDIKPRYDELNALLDPLINCDKEDEDGPS
jgi:tRNA(His) guanylyltransferase